MKQRAGESPPWQPVGGQHSQDLPGQDGEIGRGGPSWHQPGQAGERGMRSRGPWSRGPWPRAGQLRGRWSREARVSGPLRRRPEQRVLGGVASGLAARTGLDVKIVRTGFALAALLSGFGLAVYVVAWLLVPAAGESASIGSRALTDRRGLALAAGLCSLLVVVLVAASALNAAWLSTYAWALIISAGGLVLLWRNAPADEQATVRQLAEPVLGLTEGGKRSATLLRAAIAAVLLAAGVTVLVADRPRRGAAVWPLSGALLVLAALVLVLGPWWLRIARDLSVERQARARAEERADIATRVHDSVLQTLALIQRRADDPHQVVQLARAQERELRSWLFEGRAPGSIDGEDMTVAAGVRLIQREIEAQHGVPVEAVTVADVVSLFAEVEPVAVTLFVRDRGRGFDPTAVPGDRKGVAESIRGRMDRRGGSATVRSAPGEGTEVALVMPRPADEREPSRA